MNSVACPGISEGGPKNLKVFFTGGGAAQKIAEKMIDPAKKEQNTGEIA